MTKKKKQIIDFLDNDCVLDENSPEFIRRNEECIKASIDRDVNSADYVDWIFLTQLSEIDEINKLIKIIVEKGYILHYGSHSYLRGDFDIAKISISSNIYLADFVDWDSIACVNSSEEVKSLIEIIIARKYLLNKYSPDFLSRNYDIALNSIKTDVQSADYVDWDRIMKEDNSKEKTNSLIDAVIKGGYVISDYSADFLRNNPEVALASIKKNYYSVYYISDSLLKNDEIFEYALLHGYIFSFDFLANMSFNKIRNEKIIGRCFEQMKLYGSKRKLYMQRFDQLFSRAINTYPTIKPYDLIFPVVADCKWEKYKVYNIGEFVNLFGRICAELRKNDDFDEAIGILEFIQSMKETLGDQYDDFYQAMKEYFDIYHSNVKDKTEKMKPYQDIISSYANLYVNMSKDSFVKEEIRDYYHWLKQFFTLRLDNPTVDKKLVQSQKKIKFKELYRDKDLAVCQFLNRIVEKNNQELNEEIIYQLIDGFVLKDNAKLEEIVEKSANYDAYVRYERADKLIKRLNQGYISFEGPEVKSYLDIIGFDEQKGLYVYTGVSFSKEDERKISDYNTLVDIFEKIKKEIYLKIKDIDMDVKISEEAKRQLAEELPFTDEYFVFDKKYLSRITLDHLYYAFINNYWGPVFETSVFENDESYKLINDLLVDKGILWLLLFLRIDDCTHLKDTIINKIQIYPIINNTNSIVKAAKELNLNPNNFRKLLLLADISSNVDTETLKILGLDVIEKLCKCLTYTSGGKEMIISRAKRLVAKMAGRSMSTVPYVSGETMNYKYSLYDSQDVDVLLAGINTDACFKVCGNDNDFLHYCCLDKNGFVIKITDKEGNFIGRAGGFRNGNCVFLNQLRTIFDMSDFFYSEESDNTKYEIIETLQRACEDIVRTSQENELESEKIDHVFVVQDYSLSDVNANISYEVKNKIGEYPMESESQDWEDFVKDNNDYLNISKSSKGFTTDYNHDLVICLASAKKIEDLKVDDLNFDDRPAVYERTRNKIIATRLLDSDLLKKMGKIRGINAYLSGEEYEEIMIPEGATVFVGDNWYLVYADGQVVESCVLEFDEKAKREYELTKAKLDVMAIDLIKKQATSEGIDIEDVKKLNKVLTTPNE